MGDEGPYVIIRLGSHAEKEYLLKLSPFIDGVIVGANLFEATPGATTSLLLTLNSKSGVYIDPMTYAFGAYIDPQSGRPRTDLDWIKSDQLVPEGKGKKKTVRDFKRSYKALAEALGSPLSDSLRASQAVLPESFADVSNTRQFCQRVIEYQLRRVVQELRDEEELREFVDDFSGPSAVFAPYFYVEPTRTTAWLDANLALARAAAGISPSVPTHAVLCADVSHLSDKAFIARVESELPNTGVTGVWFWFSGFFEEKAAIEELRAYRNLVEALSNKLQVYAMHGGFFSLALSKWGMRGISHGIGYGEQKDVVPVIGQSTPTVRYYLPPIARRLGIPEIERSFDAIGVHTPGKFHDLVCNCAVCRGVVTESTSQFTSFGEMHRSRPSAKRSAQTPAAAKRCRFHFLLSRIRERDDVRGLDVTGLAGRLDDAWRTWGRQPTLQEESRHLPRWSAVLTGGSASP